MATSTKTFGKAAAATLLSGALVLAFAPAIPATPAEAASQISTSSKATTLAKSSTKNISKMEVNIVGGTATSFAYTGKKIKPSVKFYAKTDGGGYEAGDVIKLKKGTDYTVTYKNNKDYGTGKAIVKGTGKYTGKVTLSFEIVPPQPKIKSVTFSGKKMRVKIGKIKGGFDGWKVRYVYRASTDADSPYLNAGGETTTFKTSKTANTIALTEEAAANIAATKDIDDYSYAYIELTVYKKVGKKKIWGLGTYKYIS